MTDAQRQLHQALKAHKFYLEITRGIALPPHLEALLDRRIEAARLLLEWTSQAPTFRQAQSENVHAASVS
jgi:hypothetical protein